MGGELIFDEDVSAFCHLHDRGTEKRAVRKRNMTILNRYSFFFIGSQYFKVEI